MTTGRQMAIVSRGWCFLVLCVAVAVIAAGCGPKRSPAPEPGQDFGQEKAEAAAKGVRWLVDTRYVMPHSLGLATYRKLYKVTTDDSLAGNLLRIIRIQESASPEIETSIDIYDESFRQWHNLRPVLTELIRRQCWARAGRKDPTADPEGAAADREGSQADRDDAEEVGRLANRYWETLFAGRHQMSQKIVAAYLLGILGVGPAGIYDDAVAEARSHVGLLGDPEGHYYAYYLYALTHIVLTKSDYYGHYVDPRECGLEVGAFHMALKNFLSDADVTDTELDVMAEVLICLKLLGMPPDTRAEAASRRLMEYQNQDGSWGHGKAGDTSKIHTTAVATLALLDFAREFRHGSIFCDSRTYR